MKCNLNIEHQVRAQKNHQQRQKMEMKQVVLPRGREIDHIYPSVDVRFFLLARRSVPRFFIKVSHV